MMRKAHGFTVRAVDLQADHEANVVKIRDDLRTELSGTDFSVSDIMKWTGNSASQVGYAFIVKNGAREWLLTYPYASSFPRFGYFFGNYNSTTINEYFKNVDDTDASTTEDFISAIHYNCGLESYAMGFDTGVTYTLGDFQPPAVNPYSNLAGFMPASECLHGYYSLKTGGTSPQLTERHLLILDDISPFICYYWTKEDYAVPAHIALMGNVTQNTDGADTNNELTAGFEMEFNSSGWGYYTGKVVSVYDLGGVRMDTGLSYVASQYTFDNFDTVDGKFKWDTVTVTNGTYEKGIIDSNVVRLTGAYNSVIHFGKIISGPNGPFFRCTVDLAFPYAANIERFPWPE